MEINLKKVKKIQIGNHFRQCDARLCILIISKFRAPRQIQIHSLQQKIDLRSIIVLEQVANCKIPMCSMERARKRSMNCQLKDTKFKSREEGIVRTVMVIN